MAATERVADVGGRSAPIVRAHANSNKKNSKARRGDSKKRGDSARSYGELTEELDGTKERLKELSDEAKETEARLKEAEGRLKAVEDLSENSLKIEGMSVDFWIGDPVRNFNWEWVLLFACVGSLIGLHQFGWEREAVVGIFGVMFVLFYPYVYVHEDSLGVRKVKMARPSWAGWWVRQSLGSRHISVQKLLNERHEDLRHDCHSLMKLKHGDAAYAMVRVYDAECELFDDWTVSLELLAQLLAPKYMNPVDSLDILYERLMRDAARFNTVNVSRYYRWTEHIYIATASVAYAYAVHLRERAMGDFVLAPRSMDV
jgi:hypothetical protein